MGNCIAGWPFIFNGIPSETYNCSIVFLDEDYTKRVSGGNKTVSTVTPLRSARQRLLNVQQDEALSFNLEIVFDDPVDIHVLTQVKSWLGSPLKFCKLFICADLFDQYYFNCYFNLNEDLIYNGGYRGVTATVVCDAPWAWQVEQTFKLTSGTTKKFLNQSQDAEPLKPILTFTASTTSAYIVIETYSSDYSYDRTFIMSGNNG